MKRFEIRPATEADFLAFYGRPAPMTMRAMVAIEDGEPVGFGGYYIDHGTAVAFSDLKPQMRKRRKDIVRGARMIVGQIRKRNLPTIATPSANEASADRFLTALGFARDGDHYRLV